MVDYASIASHRVPAWEGLRRPFDKEITDAAEMGIESGLSNWNVRSEEAEHKGYTFSTPTFHTVADIGGETVILGTSGERRAKGNVQNEDMLEMGQALRAAALDGVGKATWQTAGWLKGGKQVFGTLALEQETVLDPKGVADRINKYIIVYSSHDGSLSLGGGRTAVRVRCTNTFQMALGGLESAFKFRHTASIHDKMTQIVEVWRESAQWFASLDALAETMLATPFSEKQYANYVEAFTGKAPEHNRKGALTKWEGNREKYFATWKTDANAGIRGSVWGAFNAATEREQWFRNIQEGRGDAGRENFFAAGAGFDGPTNKFRQVALDEALRRGGIKVPDVLAKVPALA